MASRYENHEAISTSTEQMIITNAQMISKYTLKNFCVLIGIEHVIDFQTV